MLQTEDQDPIHSIAFLWKELGPNAALCLREFKCCFAAQATKIATPSRKTHPNFKVDKYFCHLQVLFRYAWMSARDLSGDKQTIGFKGKRADKLRITYKKEGDGFQCDCICNERYTFTCFLPQPDCSKEVVRHGVLPTPL